MPMLTTLRIGRPVCPFQSPLRTRSANDAIRSSTRCTSGTTFSPSTTIDAPLRRPQRDVQRGALLGGVDLLAAEHRVDARGEAGGFRQREEEALRLVGDPLLRVVEVEARRLGGQAFAARRVGREELAQRALAELPLVRCQRLPRGTRRPTRAAPAIIAASPGGLRRRTARADFAALRCAVAPQMRKPPANALALSPRRQPCGQVASLSALPPPSTMSSGKSAAAQELDHLGDMLAPFLLAEALEAAPADVVLEGRLAVGKVPELHRLDDAVEDHRGAEARAQAEEQHPAAAGSCRAPASRRR